MLPIFVVNWHSVAALISYTRILWCKHASSTGVTALCNNGDNAHATWGQRGWWDNDNYASATRGTKPVQCWWWHQCNKGNKKAIVTTAKTPAQWRWWWCHCDKGNNTSLTMATTPLKQGQQHYCNDGKDAWTAKTPAHQRQQHHCSEGENASSMTAKKPPHWWQQWPHCYKDGRDNFTSTMAMTPSQRWQRCLQQ